MNAVVLVSDGQDLSLPELLLALGQAQVTIGRAPGVQQLPLRRHQQRQRHDPERGGVGEHARAACRQALHAVRGSAVRRNLGAWD